MSGTVSEQASLKLHIPPVMHYRMIAIARTVQVFCFVLIA
jgi:hypothetical protein